MLKKAWIVIVLYGTACNVYAIDDIRLTIDSIATDYFQADDVVVDLQWQDSHRLSVSISADSVNSQYFEKITSIEITCNRTDYKDQRFVCPDGGISFYSGDKANTSTGLSFTYTHNREWELRLEPLDIDCSLISSLHGYKFSQGRLQGRLEINGYADKVNEFRLDSELKGLSMEGESTVEGVDASIKLDLSNDRGTWLASADFGISAGVMYLVPGISVMGDIPGFYIETGDKPLTISMDGRWDTNDKVLYVDRFFYSHPGNLVLQAGAEINISDTTTLPGLTLKTRIEKLGRTFPVYIQPVLLKTNFSDLEIAGGMELEIEYRNNQLEILDLDLVDIYIDDNNDRFSLSGLNGNLSIRNDKTPVQSSLKWEGMSFHRLDFGDGMVVFESVENQVNVLNWDDVDVLDGKLEIENFNMKNIGTPDFEMDIDARLTPVSMLAFTQAMQWPLMSGTLSGEFSGLRYTRKNLQMNGDINIRVFNGDVILKNLNISDIFSEYSKLTADIEIDSLDLEQLTDTFTFGKIEGTLNGWINDLRLSNWRPVYFEAGLITPEDDDKPHRISRKALDNLNSLGSGLSGTMSRGAIRIFPEYSYGQIGLSCRLNNNICELGGVEDTSGGFYLLTRGGLFPPWVEVKGTGHSIRWQDLIDGLKRVSQGEARFE